MEERNARWYRVEIATPTGLGRVTSVVADGFPPASDVLLDDREITTLELMGKSPLAIESPRGVMP
jgi:hypothetical protein